MMSFSLKLPVSMRATANESDGSSRASVYRMIVSAFLSSLLYVPEVSSSR